MAIQRDDDFILISEPLNPMMSYAREAHKLLQAYIVAGFTRAEAFDLILNQIPEWNWPAHTIIDDQEIEDDDDDLYEDVPDEMNEDDFD